MYLIFTKLLIDTIFLGDFCDKAPNTTKVWPKLRKSRPIWSPCRRASFYHCASVSAHLTVQCCNLPNGRWCDKAHLKQKERRQRDQIGLFATVWATSGSSYCGRNRVRRPILGDFWGNYCITVCLKFGYFKPPDIF